MSRNQSLEKRRSQVAHVRATNDLSGVCVSKYLESKIDDYIQGRISSEQLVAAAQAQYGIPSQNSKPFQYFTLDEDHQV